MIPDEQPVPPEEQTVPPEREALASGGEAPPGEAPPPERDSPEGTDRSRWVAVLIMVVTLLGAVFTFLQTAASNRAAAATRRADAAAVEAAGEAVRAAERTSAQWRVWTLFLEESSMTVSLAGSAADGAGALAQGSYAAALATASFAGFDLTGEFGEEWQKLFE